MVFGVLLLVGCANLTKAQSVFGAENIAFNSSTENLVGINVNDTTDTIHSPGCATTGTGTCSLRDAIIYTNSITTGGGTNTITLGAGTFNLTIPGTGETSGAGDATIGDLDILSPAASPNINNLTIQGAGAGTTIIKQNSGIDRIFDVHPINTTGSVVLSISGVTITTGTPAIGAGGAILAGRAGDATTLTNCIFSNNTTTGGNGGAISQSSSSTTHNLTITNCTFTNNTSSGAGGAVSYSGQGTVNITGTTFTGNTSLSSGIGGGAISMLTTTAPGGTYNIRQNNFINNQVTVAGGGGGAIYNQNGTANINYNRFSGNNAATATNGTTLAQVTGTGTLVMNANDNWWVTNSGPAANQAVALGGTLTLTTWLQLRHTPSPSSIVTGQTSTLTAGFTINSAGAAVLSSNLGIFVGFPATINNPVRGTLSSVQTTIQASGTATATFTASTPGAGSANATVDGVLATANLTISKANTTASITSNSPNPSSTAQPVTVNYSVSVNPPGAFTGSSLSPALVTGNVMVSDGVNSCMASVAAGSCSVILTTLGARTLTATYLGDTNYNISPASAGVSQQVNIPTAAAVSVGGKVLTASGRGIGNSIIILTNQTGELRYARTNPFGYYRFNGVSVGETYVLTVRNKQYQFDQPSLVINVNEELSEINFVAIP